MIEVKTPRDQDSVSQEVRELLSQATKGKKPPSYSQVLKLARRILGGNARIWRRAGMVAIGEESGGKRVVYGMGLDMWTALAAWFRPILEESDPAVSAQTQVADLPSEHSERISSPLQESPLQTESVPATTPE